MFFRRYGRSPLKVRSLVKATVANFLELYSPSFAARGPFDSLASYADATNLSLPASFVAKDYFDKHAVSPLFSAELVSAATQVNYGTPVSQIHGVGALVSLAATGAVAVKGGNRKVFENFLGSSGATLRLGEQARVTEILKLDAAKGQRPQWVVKAPGGGGTFDVSPATTSV
jgi:prenylcysteine oxidase/farnesylcysteine lyase